MLAEQKTRNYVEWGLSINKVKNIMVLSHRDKSPDKLIEATRLLRRANELVLDFPANDIRRFITLSTSIALYCHLHCYAYVEFDRQVLLRMARRYPRPIFGDMLNSLGMLYQEHGKTNEAGQLYRRAIKLLPANHPRFNLLVANLESVAKSSISKENI